MQMQGMVTQVLYAKSKLERVEKSYKLEMGVASDRCIASYVKSEP